MVTAFFTMIAAHSYTVAGAKVSGEFRNLDAIPGIQIDLRYATANNFVGRDLYGDFREAFLHREAYAKLAKAQELLLKRRPDLRLHVFDALRPRSVQRQLFEKVKGTPQENYVADPDRGSVHNYGFAIDLSVADKKGRLLDMGTEFDDFTELAEPRKEARLLKEKKLKPEQIANRMILREAMTEAGFAQLPNEWWHFDALPLRVLRERYKIVE